MERKEGDGWKGLGGERKAMEWWWQWWEGMAVAG